MPRINEIKSEANNVIVIHPGSWFIRIGLASESAPFTDLNVIARKRKSDGIEYIDDFIPQRIDEECNQKSDLLINVNKIYSMLENSLTSDNCEREIINEEDLCEFNNSEEAIDYSENNNLTNYIYSFNNEDFFDSDSCNDNIPDAEFYVGHEVLNIYTNNGYNIHFPYKRGDFNCHSKIGGSVTSTIADLECIISYILSKHLHIEKDDFSSYKAIFIIPDIFRRHHVKRLLDLLLNKLNFESCFFIQEHVCAAFATGLNACCVVDMGDQKTSISCVEDGVSILESKIRINYGSADLAQVFHLLLSIREFPYKEFDQKDFRDCYLIRRLKDDFCHLDLDMCKPQEMSFTLKKDSKQKVRYNVLVGDESILAPLAAFYPDLLKITGPKCMIGQKELLFECDDPIDEIFLKEFTKQKKDISNLENNNDKLNEDTNNQTIEFNSDHNILESGDVFILDQAILHSIDKCQNDEVKKKMLGNILLIGGNSTIRNLRSWLLSKLRFQTQNIIQPEQIKIVTDTKDFNPLITVWKGAAFITGLETTKELWITSKDANKFGAKIIREKSIFVW